MICLFWGSKFNTLIMSKSKFLKAIQGGQNSTKITHKIGGEDFSFVVKKIGQRDAVRIQNELNGMDHSDIHPKLFKASVTHDEWKAFCKGHGVAMKDMGKKIDNKGDLEKKRRVLHLQGELSILYSLRDEDGAKLWDTIEDRETILDWIMTEPELVTKIAEALKATKKK